MFVPVLSVNVLKFYYEKKTEQNLRFIFIFVGYEQDVEESMSFEDDSEGSEYNTSNSSIDSSECDFSDNEFDDVDVQNMLAENEVLRGNASRIAVDLPNVSGNIYLI